MFNFLLGITIFQRIYKGILRRIRLIKVWFDRIIIQLSSHSGILSSLYYAIFNRSFDREHKAVLAGRVAHAHSFSPEGKSSSVLRRGIHRLEKGILSLPRREIFALGYIEETFEFYRQAVKRQEDFPNIPEEELQWAHDVLQDYFQITASHPKIDTLRKIFQELPLPQFKTNGSSCSPYQRDLSVPPAVDYDDMLELARRRRSVRWFLPKPVPRQLIRKAVDVASLSPSACNRQPYEFRVFDDPELVQQVAALPPGTRGFHHNFPAIIVLVGEMRNYYDERDRHLIYIDTSLAAMSFVYAAETLGLSTCCINWADIEEYERCAEAVLNLEPDQRPVMFMAVGYPDPEGLVAYSQKKPSRQICKFNQL